MIPFNDLRRQNQPILDELTQAALKVINSGHFVLGDEVRSFEKEFAEFVGARNCIGVASGTDAIQIALMGLGIGHGHEVITAANTCVPTIAGIAATGATPVLADIDPKTLTLDPKSVASAITPQTRAIMPVHMYGHPCDMDALTRVVNGKEITIVEDCAQAHGAEYRDQRCGSFGACASFSFYPTKNLGALGDGGAVVTNDNETAERIRALRQYGRADAYNHPSPGVNSRLDEIQAAILRVKLLYFDDASAQRCALGERYDSSIANDWVSPLVPSKWATPNRHLYVVRSPHRDALQEHLSRNGIATQVHYPIPIHLLEAYREFGKPDAFPESERACAEVLSLPLYPGMPGDDVESVIQAVNTFHP